MNALKDSAAEIARNIADRAFGMDETISPVNDDLILISKFDLEVMVYNILLNYCTESRRSETIKK